jgi:hypothetical protein
MPNNRFQMTGKGGRENWLLKVRGCLRPPFPSTEALRSASHLREIRDKKHTGAKYPKISLTSRRWW